MRKNHKKLLLVLLASILTLFLIYLGVNKDMDQVYAMKIDNFETNMAELEAKKENIEKEINTLYADEEQFFIIDTLTVEKIDEIQETIVNYEGELSVLSKELDDLTGRDQSKYAEKMVKNKVSNSADDFYISVNDLKTKKKLTDLINNLFAKEYIKNTKINTDIFITDNLESQEFEKSKTTISQQLKDNELKNEESFFEMLEIGLKLAEEQLDDLNEAFALRDEIYDDNNHLITTDIKKIESFLLAVEKIKNPEIRSLFSEYVRIAESYEIEEPVKEPEEIEDINPSYSENQESNNYQRPSNIWGSGSNSTGGSGSSSAGNSSGSSTGESGSSSSGGSSSSSIGGTNDSSSGESNNGTTGEANDETTDDSNNNNSPSESTEDSPGESDYNDHHESQR